MAPVCESCSTKENFRTYLVCGLGVSLQGAAMSAGLRLRRRLL